MKQTHKKRGFSLLEVVIAMFVITLVTIAAMTVSRQSLEASRNDMQYTEARLTVENMIEFYRTDDFATFCSRFEAAEEPNRTLFAQYLSAPESSRDEDGTRTFLCRKERCTVVFRVNEDLLRAEILKRDGTACVYSVQCLKR